MVEQLVTAMTEFYTSSSCPTPVTDIAPGKCYAIKNEDSWDRARVEALAEEDVTITYVDYGYDDLISTEYVYPLAGQFGMPVMSFQCRLVGVKPKEEDWSEEATELMRELTEDKCLMLQVADGSEDGKQGVILHDTGIPVSQMLADSNMAELVEQPSLDASHSESTISESISEFVEEIITSAKAIAEQREEMSMEEVAKEELMEVVYLQGENPHNFHVQLKGDEFTQLEASLQERYQEASHDSSVELKEDNFVLVCEEEKYYRATVVSLKENDVEVRIYFTVD